MNLFPGLKRQEWISSLRWAHYRYMDFTLYSGIPSTPLGIVSGPRTVYNVRRFPATSRNPLPLARRIETLESSSLLDIDLGCSHGTFLRDPDWIDLFFAPILLFLCHPDWRRYKLALLLQNGTSWIRELETSTYLLGTVRCHSHRYRV